MFKVISRRKNKQRGLGLLEVSLVLIVVAVMAVGISRMISDNSRALQAKSDAEKLQTVVKAAQSYMELNEAALIAATGGGVTIAIPIAKTTQGGVSPAAPAGFTSVQDGGFLPASFIDVNSAQQSHALIVKQDGAGELDAIVTTYGGAALDDSEVSVISGLVGAAGGGVYSSAAISAANEISGSRGGWGDDVANWNANIGAVPVQPAAGTVQVSMSLAEIIGSGGGGVDPTLFLHRDEDPADLTLNAMADNLYLTDFNIINSRAAGAYLLDLEGTSTLLNLDMDGSITEVAAITSTDAASAWTNAGNIRGGTLTSDGVLTVSSGGANITGTATATNLTSQNQLTVNAGGAAITGDVGVNGNYAGQGSVWARDWLATPGYLTVQGNSNLGNDSTDTTTIRGRLVTNDLAFYAPGWIDSNDGGYYVDPNGGSVFNVITARSSVNTPIVNFTSDERLKKDFAEIDGLEIISKLEPKSYHWIDGGKLSYGLVAQKVEEHLPHIVGTDENGMKSIQYVELIAPLIDAIQELEKEIEELKK